MGREDNNPKVVKGELRQLRVDGRVEELVERLRELKEMRDLRKRGLREPGEMGGLREQGQRKLEELGELRTRRQRWLQKIGKVRKEAGGWVAKRLQGKVVELRKQLTD